MPRKTPAQPTPRPDGTKSAPERVHGAVSQPASQEGTLPPDVSSPDAMRQLQRAVGNRAVGRYLQRVGLPSSNPPKAPHAIQRTFIYNKKAIPSTTLDKITNILKIALTDNVFATYNNANTAGNAQDIKAYLETLLLNPANFNDDIKDNRQKPINDIFELLNSGFAATTKVGLELTFWSTDSKKYLTNSGFPVELKREAEQWWNRLLDRWEHKIDPPLSEEEITYNFFVSGSNKDFGGGTGNMSMKRAEYTNEAQEVLFWWQMSMDPGVVEIQTAPVTEYDLNYTFIKDIINNIYAIASDTGFKPGGGGGHVNVDFITGFGGDYSLVPEIINATEFIIATLRRGNEEAKKLVEFENEKEDPFISTDRYKMDMKNDDTWQEYRFFDPRKKGEKDHYGEWNEKIYEKKKVTSLETLKLFREAHARWLHIHPTVTQYDQSSTMTGKLSEEFNMAAVLHYQAVNIDHLFETFDKDKDKEDPRRIEFRFFKGQENVNDIIGSLQIVRDIIAKARQK